MKSKKGKADKVYSVNREKFNEAIELLDSVSNKYKTMLNEPLKNTKITFLRMDKGD